MAHNLPHKEEAVNHIHLLPQSYSLKFINKNKERKKMKWIRAQFDLQLNGMHSSTPGNTFQVYKAFVKE